MTQPTTIWKLTDDLDYIQEQSAMIKPSEKYFVKAVAKPFYEHDTFLDYPAFKKATDEYEKHIASLRKLPAISFTKEYLDKELVEGRDFKVGYQVYIYYSNNPEWINVKKDTFDQYSRKEYTRLVAIPITDTGDTEGENIFNDKNIGKTIRDLPKSPTWDEIFQIATGIPTGTKNFFTLYFKPPERIVSTPVDNADAISLLKEILNEHEKEKEYIIQKYPESKETIDKAIKPWVEKVKTFLNKLNEKY